MEVGSRGFRWLTRCTCFYHSANFLKPTLIGIMQSPTEPGNGRERGPSCCLLDLHAVLALAVGSLPS